MADATFRCERRGQDVSFATCQSDFVNANALGLADLAATGQLAKMESPCFACPDGCRYRVAMATRQVPSARVVRDELKAWHVIPRGVLACDIVFLVPNWMLVEEWTNAP